MSDHEKKYMDRNQNIEPFNPDSQEPKPSFMKKMGTIFNKMSSKKVSSNLIEGRISMKTQRK